MMNIRKRSVAFFLAVLLCGMLAPAAAAAEDGPEITAYSAIVMDYRTGEVLFEKDADTMRVPASMTKVMTAYIIFEELEAGRLTLDTQVPISDNAARISQDTHYPSRVPLPSGGMVTAEKLLELIMVPSASASCVAMAEYISGSEGAFVQRMNDTAARLGLTAAYENCHGAMPHYITARSQAMLVREFIRRFPQVLSYTSRTDVEFDGKIYPNTNHLLPGTEYAYEGADGFKTGTIKEAGYCLSATARRDGRRLISVVMHSEDTEARHTDSIALLDYGFQVLADRLQPQEGPEQKEDAGPKARAASQDIEINGVKVPFQTYMLIDGQGNGTNYVRIRDIAHALNGTGAQFSVGYDSERGIALTTGRNYEDIGIEMDTPFAGQDRSYSWLETAVAVNGAEVWLDTLTLLDENGNGYNYFKLRDLGAALDFKVGYSNARGVYVETR